MGGVRFLLLLCHWTALLQWTQGKDNNNSNKAPPAENDSVFRCPVLAQSSPVPTSVHSLRPSDIRVVAALGDSMTAGTAVTAKTLPDEFIMNRGLSWSGGGQGTLEDHVTMPNILKKYSNHLYGYATGDGRADNVRAHLNLAEPGADSGDLENQARKLVKKIKEDAHVDFINDWKIITILFGVNDICRYCKKPNDYNQARFHLNLIRGLDVLHAELPRTLVNLVEVLNMTAVTHLNQGWLCSGLHVLVCECAAFPKTAADEARLEELTAEYQRTVKTLSRSGRYDTRTDFTVVHQPCMSQTDLPLQDKHPDMSYFAPDCFHPSAKGQAAAAIALWNNMVTPMEDKLTEWTPGDVIKCPSEDQPYIYTNRNTPKPLPASDHSTSPFFPIEVLTAITVCGSVVGVIGSVIFYALCRQYGRKRDLYVQIPSQ